MFNWQRPADMSAKEPTEESIWRMIDERDPRGTANILDRLEQHQEMLQGRSTFGKFFSYSSILPDCKLDSSAFREPAEWIKTIKLKCGEFNPLESTVDQISYGYCDILEPASDAIEPVRQSKLLAHRQLQESSLDWPRDSLLGRLTKPPAGYVTWARYILQAHKDVLNRAGVYKAIYASMFNYEGIPPSWIKGVVEFWDSTTNTCWVGPEELTITLWELQLVSGLPIFGRRYEECIPPDEELFRRQPSNDNSRRGEMILPEILPQLLSHYKRVCDTERLSKRSTIAIPPDAWIRSFLREDCLDQPTTSLHDPFGLGLSREDMLTEESAQPRREIGYNSPSLPEITEDLFLAGFIATWLCTFVLPIKDTHVRATVLFTASLISKGERVSLAPPVLGRIYRIFKAISNSSSLEVQNTLPWQYIYAWVHIHVRGAFGCLDYPAFFSERSYPMIMQLTRATSTWERERVRLFFFAPHLVADRFSLAHRPEINEFPDGITGMNMVDSVAQQGRYTLLARGRSFKIAEYFISMRPGWLCYRSGSLVILEKYNPNRVAR